MKSFVNDLTKFDTDFDLVSADTSSTQKSIMGIFSSTPFLKPIDLNIHDGGNTEEIPIVFVISLKHKKVKLPETKFRFLRVQRAKVHACMRPWRLPR